MNTRPPPTNGLRHVALYVHDMAACERFYVDLIGMKVEWRPDPDNVYMTTGHDNLAIHRASGEFAPDTAQRMDHIGFIINDPNDIDNWHEYLLQAGVTIKKPPRQHRDGAKSLYCLDPDGNTVQLIYHPPLADKTRPETTAPGTKS